MTSDFRFWCPMPSDLLFFHVDIQSFHNQFGEFIIIFNWHTVGSVQTLPCLLLSVGGSPNSHQVSEPVLGTLSLPDACFP